VVLELYIRISYTSKKQSTVKTRPLRIDADCSQIIKDSRREGLSKSGFDNVAGVPRVVPACQSTFALL
jgi:hypothetical protein